MVDSVSKSDDESVHNSVRCGVCGSENVGKFGGEVAVHFRGATNIDKPTVWIFPELLVCLNCGVAQFAVPKAELRTLVKGKVAGS